MPSRRGKARRSISCRHFEVFPYLRVGHIKATWRLPLNKILISRWLADITHDEYGIHNVDLVPNAVDTDQFFAPTRARSRLRRSG